ncbi:hypothetical protein V6N13_053990 [Hibiscus sabdariffa]
MLFYKQDQFASILGFIIRDTEGQVLAVGSRMNLNILDPTTTEAISALQALKFAAELDFHKIVLEGDSLTVIKKLQRSEEDISVLTAFVGEAKAKHAKCRRGCVFCGFQAEDLFTVDSDADS